MTDRSDLTPPAEASRSVREPDISPMALLVLGGVIAVVAAGIGLLGGNEFVAFLAYGGTVVGATIVLVGAIAAGVRLGVHWARFDRLL